MVTITRSNKLQATAQEYLIIVGAPSNMFNGYVFEEVDQLKTSPTKPPASAANAEVTKYIIGDPNNRNYTHDRYWANFLFSAVTLMQKGSFRPEPGDILTFAIYLP